MKWFKKKETYNEYCLGENIVLRQGKQSSEKVLINTQTGQCKMIVDDSGNIVGFTLKDINFERVDKLENNGNARNLYSPYAFEIEGFIRGVSLLSWVLYPDGRYFEDEDGYGGENCNETMVYAFMDCKANIVIPFQDMDDSEMKTLRAQAEKIAKNNQDLE